MDIGLTPNLDNRATRSNSVPLMLEGALGVCARLSVPTPNPDALTFQAEVKFMVTQQRYAA
jgi:hypothetical protein